MFEHLKRKFIVNILFIFILLIVVLISCYFIYSIKIEILVLDINKRLENLKSFEYCLMGIALISSILFYFFVKLITGRFIESIESIFNRQTEFISEISHELKNPLTIAITNLSVIKSHQDERVHSQVKWFGYIEFQLARLCNLTDEILVLEQFNSFQQHKKENFNLSLLLNWYLSSLRALLKGENISLNKKIEENIYIYADKEHISRLISILVDNAIKYTPEYGIITINLGQTEKNVFISVENTGEGIEPEYIGRIFDRFYQINKSKSGSNTGSGLGLAIAKSIVENIKGGKISVESTVGEKTTFYVTLPIKK